MRVIRDNQGAARRQDVGPMSKGRRYNYRNLRNLGIRIRRALRRLGLEDGLFFEACITTRDVTTHTTEGGELFVLRERAV